MATPTKASTALLKLLRESLEDPTKQGVEFELPPEFQAAVEKIVDEAVAEQVTEKVKEEVDAALAAERGDQVQEMEPVLNDDGTPKLNPDGTPMMQPKAKPAEGTAPQAPAAPAEPSAQLTEGQKRTKALRERLEARRTAGSKPMTLRERLEARAPKSDTAMTLRERLERRISDVRPTRTGLTLAESPNRSQMADLRKVAPSIAGRNVEIIPDPDRSDLGTKTHAMALTALGRAEDAGLEIVRFRTVDPSKNDPTNKWRFIALVESQEHTGQTLRERLENRRAADGTNTRQTLVESKQLAESKQLVEQMGRTLLATSKALAFERALKNIPQAKHEEFKKLAESKTFVRVGEYQKHLETLVEKMNVRIPAKPAQAAPATPAPVLTESNRPLISRFGNNPLGL